MITLRSDNKLEIFSS
jgi:hypothetical protein